MAVFYKSKFSLTITVLLFYGTLFATGPSSINSEIKPVSINTKGEILCKTKFSKNEMGAHNAMILTYGYCIIIKDTVIQYVTQEVNPDGYPDYDSFYKHINYWDSIFNSCYNINQLSEIGNMIKNHYHFNSCNVSAYKTDKIMLITEIENQKQIDLNNTAQIALYGAKSTDYFDRNRVHILYDFGEILILKNINNEDDEIQIGADFDYFNPWTNDKGIIENRGFDISEITGILRVN